MRAYFDADADPALVTGKKITVFGYGNQGRAQALNLRDSGARAITIAARQDGPSWTRARGDGFSVAPPVEAAAGAEILVMLVPDEDHASLYRDIETSLRSGAALVFAHGLSVRFGLIAPRADLDVVLVAPKGPGTALRSGFEAGSGLLSLFAVQQDASGSAEALALSYGAALGSGRVGMLRTSFAEECEADLFNEQAVLWGAIPELIHAGFETLVEAGFSPEVAYLECLTEVKLIADLIYERGIAGMREAISNTAEFGAMIGGPRMITDETRAEMRRTLAEVRSGAFAADLLADASSGYPRLRSARAAAAAHPIEAVGRKLRRLNEGPN